MMENILLHKAKRVVTPDSGMKIEWGSRYRRDVTV